MLAASFSLFFFWIQIQNLNKYQSSILKTYLNPKLSNISNSVSLLRQIGKNQKMQNCIEAFWVAYVCKKKRISKLVLILPKDNLNIFMYKELVVVVL